MSGWFGVSNPELNDPFYGINAGYARRKSHQKQRYYSMGRMSIDEIARRNRAASAQANAAVSTRANGMTTQKYNGYDLETTYVDPLRTYSTKVKQGGITRKTTQGSSKGQSVNAAKNWVDAQVASRVDPSIKRAMQKAQSKAQSQSSNPIAIQTMTQNILNQELANRSTFNTEVSTDPGMVAIDNRNQALIDASNQFRPEATPNDFVAGKYTVSVNYNPTMKVYMVTVRSGNVGIHDKKFSQNDGNAAISYFNQMTSLAEKKAMYDSFVEVSQSQGKYTVKLEVSTGTTLNGILGLFGLGSWADMPEKTLQIVLIDNETQTILIRGPPVRADEQSYANAKKAVLEDTQSIIDEYETHYDQPDEPLTEVPAADGSGGDITDTVVDDSLPAETVIPEETVIVDETPVSTMSEPAENYNDIVEATPASTTQASATSINTEMSDGDFYRTYNRSQEYQPTSTYQAQSTQIVPTAAAPSNNTALMVGGALALAGAVYLSQNRK